MSSMYDLTNDYLQVLEMATDPDINPQAIVDTLESIGGEIELKAENTAKIMKILEGEVNTISAEQERLAARKESIKRNISSIKERLYQAMKLTHKEKFKTALFSFSIGKNPPALVIDDESKIPEKYLQPQPPKVDKAAIKNALKDGEILDYAHLEQGESLKIK